MRMQLQHTIILSTLHPHSQQHGSTRGYVIRTWVNTVKRLPILQNLFLYSPGRMPIIAADLHLKIPESWMKRLTITAQPSH